MSTRHHSTTATVAPGTRPGDRTFNSLESLLDAIGATARRQETISIEDILEVVGRRWYGPLLFVAGLVILTPVIGDIPGVPTMMGVIVILISVQLLWKRQRVWLPRWICEQHIGSNKVEKALRWSRRFARFLDSFTSARMAWALTHAGLVMIALMCIMMAALTPLLELIPFSSNLAGVAITAFGISVLAEDGVVALVAVAFCVATLCTGGYFLLGI